MAIERTIMIVDDSRIMRNTIKGIIIGMGLSNCTFLEAEDGEEAMNNLNIFHVDLVLLDWNMPKLLGIDFLKQIRAISKYNELPIIMVTSETTKFNVIEALKSGANDYITKPINGEVFKEKLSRWLIFRK